MLSQFRPYEGVPGVPNRMQCMISLIEVRILAELRSHSPGQEVALQGLPCLNRYFWGCWWGCPYPSKLLRPLENKTWFVSRKKHCPGGKASSAQPAILHRHSLGYVVVFHGDTPIAGWCIVENPIRMNDLGLLPFLDTSLYLDFFICLGYVGFDTYNSWLTCGN